MKFRIFTLSELIYKWLSYSTIAGVTILSIIFYLLSDNDGKENNLLNPDEITFILSMVYALFLFVVGAYISSVSSKIQSMFYKRKEQYRNLIRLSELYQATESKDKDLFSTITMNRIFTGRAEKSLKSYIVQDGFNYTNKYLRLETSFMEKQNELKEDWESSIRKYLISSKMQKNDKNVFIFSLEVFLNDIDSWIDDELELTEEQSNSLKQYIKQIQLDLKKDIKKYNKMKKEMYKANRKISKKTNIHILRLERIYGDRLTESIKSEEALLANLEFIANSITELKGEVLRSEEIFEIGEEHYQKVREYLNEMDSKINILINEFQELSESIDY